MYLVHVLWWYVRNDGLVMQKRGVRCIFIFIFFSSPFNNARRKIVRRRRLLFFSLLTFFFLLSFVFIVDKFDKVDVLERGSRNLLGRRDFSCGRKFYNSLRLGCYVEDFGGSK